MSPSSTPDITPPPPREFLALETSSTNRSVLQSRVVISMERLVYSSPDFVDPPGVLCDMVLVCGAVRVSALLINWSVPTLARMSGTGIHGLEQ